MNEIHEITITVTLAIIVAHLAKIKIEDNEISYNKTN